MVNSKSALKQTCALGGGYAISLVQVTDIKKVKGQGRFQGTKGREGSGERRAGKVQENEEMEKFRRTKGWKSSGGREFRRLRLVGGEADYSIGYFLVLGFTTFFQKGRALFRKRARPFVKKHAPFFRNIGW